MDLVEKWKQLEEPAQGGSMDVGPDLSVITLGVIARVALGRTLKDLGEELVKNNFETGKLSMQFPLKKGQLLLMNIGAYQRQSPRWGPDPHIFRPARWLDGSIPGMKDGIGVYSNMLTFLSGNHTCLGWRLAVLEMQVILATLVSKFSFSLPESDDEQVIPCFQSTVIPVLPSGKKGAPLRVSPVF
ncbi:Cytochrome P450 [Mycena chlorophos]|uniref:Cytochrome P450 n=1 Tax=Mycena chlorophos TaxID=658473 RepID=A0A8H6WNG9_MYCCL|nr:Cytochrome P450 [Mycena chlorophos]